MPEELFDPAMVLVADDDTATRNLLSGLLKAQGYRVFGAQDGQEALDFLLTHDPAVALLDVMMLKCARPRRLTRRRDSFLSCC